MKAYLLSASAGVLVGAIYALLNVRSPAPPFVALVGLLGILVGEQAVPIAQRWLQQQPITAHWLGETCRPHVFGELPRPGAPLSRDASRSDAS
jgi:XapX domain-containing protein